jgi:hypothetical protein
MLLLLQSAAQRSQTLAIAGVGATKIRVETIVRPLLGGDVLDHAGQAAIESFRRPLNGVTHNGVMHPHLLWIAIQMANPRKMKDGAWLRRALGIIERRDDLKLDDDPLPDLYEAAMAKAKQIKARDVRLRVVNRAKVALVGRRVAATLANHLLEQDPELLAVENQRLARCNRPLRTAA